MSFLTSITVAIAAWVAAVIAALGYPGLVLLMALESTAVPLPSELVMPFAGFLAAQGEFSFWLVLLFSTLGTLLGSLLSYYLGAYGAEPLLRRYGRYLLIEKKDLEKTERWFKKRGDATIFLARLIPVARHLISIPAGMARMDLKKFCFYTVAGGLLWNAFLAWLGYLLGANWALVRHYTEPLSYAVVALLLIGLVVFVVHHLKRK